MKHVIMHIVGNRPQFIKLAPVSRELRKRGYEEVIVHTGQHYDENMSDIFFKELDIQLPKVNLNVKSGTHAQTTAKVMSSLEGVIIREQPSSVIIYGDTNSTLAAAIVVSKMNIPLFHVEAGPRTHDKTNPEEQNRIVVDHLSDYLFAPDRISIENLKKEGLSLKQIIFSGDVMYDQFLYSIANSSDISIEKYPNDFILMTWHRQENTCNRERMEKMLSFIEKINYKIIFPIHPRTQKILSEYGLYQRIQDIKNMVIINPVGYREMMILLSHCKLLISDSGGTSKEAAFAGKKCFLPLNLEFWPELMKAGYINKVDIENELSVLYNLELIKEEIGTNRVMKKVDYFGNGNAAEIIVDSIEQVLLGGLESSGNKQ